MTGPGPRSVRRAATAAAAFGLAAAVLAGCSSEQAMPQIAFPSASAAGQLIGAMPVSPSPSYTGYAPPLNAVTAQVSGIPDNARLSYPMSWLTFTVTYANTSTFAFQGLDPLIVFGQCTCAPANYGIAPSTNLQVWNAAAGTWKAVNAAEQNAAGTFKYAAQLGSIDLGPKASVTYKYRFELGRTAARETGLVDGTGSLNVFVLQLPRHTRVSAGLAPEASVPLAYVFG
jgi:hypothetical protein